MIYTLTLNPAIDYFMAYPNEVSKWQVTSEVKYLAGGKGIMAASHLQSLSVPSCGVVVVGGLLGHKFVEILKTQINHYALIETASETRINVKSNFADQTLELNVKGEKVHAGQINAELFSFFSKNLKPQDVVMIMGSLPPGYESAHLKDLAEFLMKHHVKLVFDLSQGDLLKAMIAFKPEVVKPNRAELAALFAVELKTDEQVFIYAKKLLALGAKRVLVSLDKAGALYVDHANSYEIKGVTIKEVNSAGAGDSMIAGFVAGLELGLPLPDVLKLAAASGTAKASSVGVATKMQVDYYQQLIKLQRREDV